MDLGFTGFLLIWAIWHATIRNWSGVHVFLILAVVTIPTAYWANDLPVPLGAWYVSAGGFAGLIAYVLYLYRIDRSSKR